MKTLVDYAKVHLGIPYIWGGENPMKGFDCSGFVQFVLRSVGMDPVGDQSAQMLYDWGKKNFYQPTKAAGALAFYGKSPTMIYHVGLMINEFQIIEAAGGDHTCVSKAVAEEKGACVRIRPVEYRKDFVGVMLPKYPDWVKNV